MAALKSCENVPLASWMLNELVLLLAVSIADVLLAQASLLTPFGFRDPPSH